MKFKINENYLLSLIKVTEKCFKPNKAFKLIYLYADDNLKKFSKIIKLFFVIFFILKATRSYLIIQPENYFYWVNHPVWLSLK